MVDLESNLQPEQKTKIAPIGLPETVQIILEENDNIPPNGLFVSINGRGYILRPGILLNVPHGVVDILDHAVESKPVLDPDKRNVIGYRDRTRYPYRRVNAAAQAA